MSSHPAALPTELILLYVEDEVLIREMVLDAFENSGFSVIAASTAAQAMAALEDSAGEICGLITDIQLNSELSGWDIARLARAMNPGMPVIYASGANGHDWPAQGVAGSVMITKPFVPAELVSAMIALLGDVPEPLAA